MVTRTDVRRVELRRVAVRLIGGGAAVYALLAVVGLLLTRVFENGPVVRADRRVSQWFFEQRTPTLNAATHVGTMLSDTVTAIVVTAVLVVALRLWLGRWRPSVTILASIAGELFVFLLVTATVHRQRPTVPHLDPAPPTSSFPSGHTGAAVALYVCLAVILLRVTQGLLARAAAVLLCLVPVVVALCRIYRGMHFLTDVIAGAVAGGLWTAIVLATLLPRSAAVDRA